MSPRRDSHSWSAFEMIRREVVAFSRKISSKLGDDRLSDLSAAFSYYALLSLAPFSVGLILASTFLPEKMIDGVFVWIDEILGERTRDAFYFVWTEAKRPGPRTLAGFLSLVGVLLFASAVFNQLHRSLNTIFGVKRAPLKMWVRKRLLSMGLSLGAVFIFIVAAVATSFLTALEQFLPVNLPVFVSMLAAIALTLTITLLYRWLPDTSVSWWAAFPSAILVMLGMTASQSFFSWIMSFSTTFSLYGAAAALPLFLVWVYITSYVFFLGAELAFALNKKL
jgi:membrane protein